MSSTRTCGLAGGKKAIICGVGGRDTAGRWVRDERAAEEEAVERVEKVRWRASRTERDWGWDVATVATERAEEMEVRRAREGWGDVGDVDGDEERCGATSASRVTATGSSGDGLGARDGWPKDWPRMRGWGRSSGLYME
jgi:hypothetical protein